MRSKLFVPGSRPELFPKAMASAADALSLDLEDAVAEPRKAQARSHVAAFLADAAKAGANSKVLIVRVNGTQTPHFEEDVAAVVGPALDLLNLPKAETVEQVHAAIGAIERAEQRAGAADPARPVRLLLNIESPRGLRCAAELAACHPRVAGLQIGYGDLFEPLQIARRGTANVHAAMFAVRMAAAEAGVFAYDGAYADVQDEDGWRAEAQMARRLGYLGKSCIHPSQIALANDVFQPSAEEIARALRVLDAAGRAQAESVGAFMVAGQMVDRPFVRQAETLIATARRLGLA
jgi:citrate lyase subunit beta/citryl-CoA lyase